MCASNALYLESLDDTMAGAVPPTLAERGRAPKMAISILVVVAICYLFGRRANEQQSIGTAYYFGTLIVRRSTSLTHINPTIMALPTKGRVIIDTTVGEIDIELWSKVCHSLSQPLAACCVRRA